MDPTGTPDVAAILGVSQQRVLQLVESGALRSRRISYRHLFDRAEVERFAAERAARAGGAQTTPRARSRKK